jgi:hypothetical protein
MTTSQEYKQMKAVLVEQRKRIHSSPEEREKVIDEMGIRHLLGDLAVIFSKQKSKAAASRKSSQ